MHSVKPDYISRQNYEDGMRKRAEQANGTYSTTPSKAWLEDQGENVRRQTSSSAAMRYDDDDFKPLPVVKKVPDMVRAPPSTNKPLKSAMKVSSIKKLD